jgi:hypothetical protein
MIGFFLVGDGDFEKPISAMDKVTREWEMRAARGECSWVCADCCSTFPAGMPDACDHGHQNCTDIIQRDKRAAAQEVAGQTSATSAQPTGEKGGAV